MSNRLESHCAATVMINCHLDVVPADLSVVTPPGPYMASLKDIHSSL